MSANRVVSVTTINRSSYLTIGEMSQLMNVRRQEVWKLAHDGQIRALRGNVTGCYYIPVDIKQLTSVQLRVAKTIDTQLINVYGVIA